MGLKKYLLVRALIHLWNTIDGSVKSPNSALCFILQSFNVLYVRLMIPKLARLEFELYTKPSELDFLRVHHH